MLNGSLPRLLSRPEAWAFGFTGLLLWVFMAPGAQSALGWWSLPMWVVVTAFGMCTNRQIRRLAQMWPDVAGGTPNYTARLLAPRSPWLARYAAMAYFQGWASVPTLSAVLLAQLAWDRFAGVGLVLPRLLLIIALTAGPFLIALAGTRVLSVMQVVFLLPALGSLAVFVLTGLWEAPSGLLSSSAAPDVLATDLAKWFFVATYCAYSVETASSFVADSRRPGDALSGLRAATWCIPLLLVGGSVVLVHTGRATDAGEQDLLTSTALHLFGPAGAVLITFLVAAATLLSMTTGVVNSPRVLFQLARDGMAAPLLGRLTRRGVPASALILTMLVSLVYLLIGNALTALAVTSVGWFFSFMCLHLALWLDRDQPHIGLRAGRTALAILVVEVPVFLIGGLAWGVGTFAVGLAAPAALLAIDAALARLPDGATHLPARWRHAKPAGEPSSGIVVQVAVLSVVATGTLVAGWSIGWQPKGSGTAGAEALVVLALLAVFTAVALAAWTSLNQVQRVLDSRDLARAEANHLLRSARDGVLVADADGRVNTCNPAAVALLGEEVLLGRPLAQMLAFAAAAPTQWPERSTFTAGRPAGQEQTIEVTVSRARLETIDEYVLVLRDVTEQRDLQDKLAYQAGHDALTGLTNRAHFSAALGASTDGATDEQAPCALLSLDLDGFKPVNDALGHAAGDQVLVAVAQRLVACVRPGDVVARLGGDEFALLVPGVADPTYATNLAKRILARLEEPFLVAGQQIRVGASIGVSLRLPGGASSSLLLQEADQAMYTAKHRGRNRYATFEPNMLGADGERLALTAELLAAIELGELQLHYQPIIDAGTGYVVTVEALVRWQHPKRGLLAPNAFLPQAHAAGLMPALGAHVLNAALHQLAAWRLGDDRLRDLCVSVNLSPSQLTPGLTEAVDRALRRADLDPQALILEITENSFADLHNECLAELHKLRTLGVQLSIDDFGTGYSSLARLRELPVHEVKIDRSFISPLKGAANDPLLLAIVGLARGLGLRTVAEGVETEEQAAILRLIGVDALQGYLFARPEPSAPPAHLLKEPADR